MLGDKHKVSLDLLCISLTLKCDKLRLTINSILYSFLISIYVIDDFLKILLEKNYDL